MVANLRDDAGVLPAPTKTSRRHIWGIIRAVVWRWRFRRALARAVPAELRPLLNKPYAEVTAKDINRLRTALEGFLMTVPTDVQEGDLEALKDAMRHMPVSYRPDTYPVSRPEPKDTLTGGADIHVPVPRGEEGAGVEA